LKEIFKQLIVDSQQREFGDIVQRDYQIPLDTKKIVSLIGIRRSGKTWLLYDLIKKLRERIPPQNIVYINFEDDRLYPISLKDLDALVQAYYELYPDKRDEKVYFFLDEIQTITGWERFVRRLYDTLNIQLFITGSSSKLLAGEIATALRGRTITYEVFPFSFAEYLRYRNIEINLYASKSQSYIKNAFATYLVEGGFAEIFDEPPDLKRRILQDYLDLIIYRDIVERYRIKNHTLLKHLIKYLFVNIGTLVSFTKLYNDYKSMGYRVSKETLLEYVGYLEEAYAIFSVPIFRNSVKEEQRHPKKIYAIDNGFKSLFDAFLSQDYSKLYENLAFLHLRRQTSQIYYFKGKQEVDLYASLQHKILLNVSYQIDDSRTLQREIEGLMEGMEWFGLDRSYLITADEERIIEKDGRTIEIKPMWKWLLEGVE